MGNTRMSERAPVSGAGETLAKIQRVGNLVADLAHPRGDHRQNDSEDEAHDLLRELREMVSAHARQQEGLRELIAARKFPDGRWKALGDPELAYAVASLLSGEGAP